MELSLKQIKTATDAGINVYTGSKNYLVIKDKIGQYLIRSIYNNHYVGLTGLNHADENKPPEGYGPFFIDTKTD